MISDNPPDTLRTCEACGGSVFANEDIERKPRSKCPWCTNGLQTTAQLSAWSDFRSNMRFISGTYSFLEDTVGDLLSRLDKIGGDKASDLRQEGSELLSAWLCASPLHGGRDRITERLKHYNSRVLDFLTKRPWEP